MARFAYSDYYCNISVKGDSANGTEKEQMVIWGLEGGPFIKL